MTDYKDRVSGWATDIDWSKAPEGATHWGPENSAYVESWYKKCDGKWMCATYSSRWQWEYVVFGIKHEREIELIARPAPQWNGEGLPPVGITCRIPDEMASGNPFLEKFEGVTAHIIAHTASATGSPLAVFWYEKPDGSRRFHALVGDNGNFEPIKTPAQIAAEEREAAVRELAGAIMGHAIGCRLPMSESGAERLADHLMMDGYTKTKGDDK